MKKLTILVALLLVVALAVPTYAASLSDVPSDHWAYDAVEKLVAAGVLEGYPDGTFKGDQPMTRYEIAMVVSRMLDNIEEEREAMADELGSEIDTANGGLSTGEAQDVTAIVKSLIEKNMPEEQEAPEGLDEDEVTKIVKTMIFEFEQELQELGADVDALGDLDADVAELQETVAELKEDQDNVSFGGSYAVDYTDRNIEEDAGIYDQEIDYYYEAGGTLVPVYKDAFVYSDPWDSDSDELDAGAVAGEIEQTLTLNADISKGGFTAQVNLDVHEDDSIDDVLSLASAELVLENDSIKATYNNDNTADVADYVFSSAGYNGVDVEVKNYGVNTFFGVKGYDTGRIPATTDEEWTTTGPGGGTVTFEATYPKFDDSGEQIYEDEDFYVYGAQKSFDVAGLELNTKAAGRHYVDQDELEDYNDNYFGVDVATDAVGLGLTFDLGYYMPGDDNEDSGTLYRLGASKDLDIANIAFNYKNRGENFEPLSGDDVVFDADDDDYDRFTTGLGEPDMSGWNLSVKPDIFFEDLDSEVFYGSVSNYDGNDNDASKLSLTGEMPLLIDGLTVNGEYTTVDDDWYDKKESTMLIGGEYAMNDYITADASYETVENVMDLAANDGIEKTTTAFGVDMVDYPLIYDLTVSAGFSMENIGEDYDENTTKYNLGLGYAIGAADLSYDYTNYEKEGDTVANGVYTTNELGLVYSITDNTDLTADYDILELDAENDNFDYKIHEVTAGVSVSF